jgi:hypothetical protein
MWGTFVGLGGVGSSAILAEACCGEHGGWLWLVVVGLVGWC